MFIFPVQLTTSRIGNLIRLIIFLLYVSPYIHTYIHTYIRCYAFLGAWLRAGEDIGWLAAGTMPNSLYRMPLVYLFLTCVFCYSCSFDFVVFCVFVFFFCSHWSLIDVPLIFFCPADHVPDWQPCVLLGMVEARSVNVKKTTTYIHTKYH